MNARTEKKKHRNNQDGRRKINIKQPKPVKKEITETQQTATKNEHQQYSVVGYKMLSIEARKDKRQRQDCNDQSLEKISRFL
jgi:hypothetical protein